MTYEYRNHRDALFTEQHQPMFLSIMERADELLSEAGAFKLDRAISGQSGDTWMMLACVDRLVELGRIVEVTKPGVWGQDRVFVRAPE